MKKSTNIFTSPITFSRRTRVVISSLLVLVGTGTTSWLIIARCSASADLSSHGRGAFTEAEKQAMMTRSAPPKEAISAMRGMYRLKKAGEAKVVSPWAKPQVEK